MIHHCLFDFCVGDENIVSYGIESIITSMTQDFIEKHCLQCQHHFVENSEPFCWLEIYYSDGIRIPTINEQDDCSLGKEE